MTSCDNINNANEIVIDTTSIITIDIEQTDIGLQTVLPISCMEAPSVNIESITVYHWVFGNEVITKDNKVYGIVELKN